MAFTTDDLISFINLSHTLNDSEKERLIMRVLDELDLRGNRLSSNLAEELLSLWDIEQVYLETVLLPQLKRDEEEAENEHQAELERIRPQLDRLVEEYTYNTQELITEYDKAFRQIDLETDQFLQKHTKSHEASEIEAIKAKLSKSSSSSNNPS